MCRMLDFSENSMKVRHKDRWCWAGAYKYSLNLQLSTLVNSQKGVEQIAEKTGLRLQIGTTRTYYGHLLRGILRHGAAVGDYAIH